MKIVAISAEARMHPTTLLRAEATRYTFDDGHIAHVWSDGTWRYTNIVSPAHNVSRRLAKALAATVALRESALLQVDTDAETPAPKAAA